MVLRDLSLLPAKLLSQVRRLLGLLVLFSPFLFLPFFVFGYDLVKMLDQRLYGLLEHYVPLLHLLGVSLTKLEIPITPNVSRCSFILLRTAFAFQRRQAGFAAAGTSPQRSWPLTGFAGPS